MQKLEYCGSVSNLCSEDCGSPPILFGSDGENNVLSECDLEFKSANRFAKEDKHLNSSGKQRFLSNGTTPLGNEHGF